MEIKYTSKIEMCPFGMTDDTHEDFKLIASISCQECIYFSGFIEVKKDSGIFHCSYNLRRGL